MNKILDGYMLSFHRITLADYIEKYGKNYSYQELQDFINFEFNNQIPFLKAINIAKQIAKSKIFEIWAKA